jgi:hypothetical protein
MMLLWLDVTIEYIADQPIHYDGHLERVIQRRVSIYQHIVLFLEVITVQLIDIQAIHHPIAHLPPVEHLV